jgi:hypothetical protein
MTSQRLRDEKAFRRQGAVLKFFVDHFDRLASVGERSSCSDAVCDQASRDVPPCFDRCAVGYGEHCAVPKRRCSSGQRAPA